MLEKAEKNLDEILDLDVEEAIVTPIGILKDKSGEIIKKTNSNLLRIKQDTSKFVAERLGKNEGYSAKTELESNTPLVNIDINIEKTLDKIYGEPITSKPDNESQ
jgi:hypothetical protein